MKSVFPNVDRRTALNASTIDSLVRISVLALLVYWSALLVQPFLVLITWSVILATALYPIFSWSVRRLHLNRVVAAAIMTAICLIVLLGPATWLGLSLGATSRSLAQRLGSGELAIPPPFAGLKRLPLIGDKGYELWALASTNLQAALAQIGPQLKPLASRLIVLAGSAGTSILSFTAAVVLAGFLYVPGPALVGSARSIFRRLTTEHGDEYVELVGASIRNLARGVIGVALLQSLLVGVGLIVAGVPAAGLISLLVLILGVVQIGSAIVLVPVVVWCFFTMELTAAILISVYLVPVGLMDNFLRPLIMAHGLKTPMPVILLGLFGGILLHGLIGLFVGPVVLAVAWELLALWTSGPRDRAATPSAGLPGKPSKSMAAIIE